MSRRTITFDDVVLGYLDNKDKDKRVNQELEIRFGTMRNSEPITRTNYDNVIKRVLSAGFKLVRTEYMLRVIPEFKDKQGGMRLSNVRVEINGLPNIKEYCNTDSYNTVDHLVTQKLQTRSDDGRNYSIDVEDYNFRMSISSETNVDKGDRIYNSLTESWSNVNKIFRYIQRYTFSSEEMPFIQFDISMVKESTRRDNVMIPTRTIKQSNVFDNKVKYEVEIEIINDQIGKGTRYKTLPEIIPILRKGINLILSGIQGTNYPISISEKRYVIEKYKQLIGSTNRNPKYTSDFIGPSSMTLQMNNIIEQPVDVTIPNIRNEYTVTDKADGDRKLLYISHEGKIYLIDTNMNIQFSGCISSKPDYYETILDGEHISNDKNGLFINTYAAFDVYFIKGVNVRNSPFVSTDVKGRLQILNDIKSKMGLGSINKSIKVPPLNIRVKDFLIATKVSNIFKCCKDILDREKSGGFIYNIDGIIFTPAYLGVGSATLGKPGPMEKRAWRHSFKWKPPKFNTIDFMVSTIKDISGTNDKIDTEFYYGKSKSKTDPLKQYKTVILNVGFNERDHGYVDPCKSLKDGIFNDSSKDGSGYRPVQFYPTEPYDEHAGICKIHLSQVGGNIEDSVMLTEEGEVMEDKQIVEFSYDVNGEDGFKWKPLRVRYDKTAELLAGGKNYGNAYHVANSNWHSIHNPISSEMISSGVGIPSDISDNVYYNRTTSKSNTVSLRDFHNLFIKNKLVSSVSKPGDYLIDMAVGKGGDWSKWLNADIGFVLGIDISKDNIENKLDGVCARTLNYHKKYRKMPGAVFLNGDTSKNIKNGDAFYTESDKTTIKSLFGSTKQRDIPEGEWIKKNIGICKDGFDVSSIQFALHYMFENQTKVIEFMRNLSETTKLGGYFIGTCYDGTTVFNLLRDKGNGDSHTITNNGMKIWEVTKRYEGKEFNGDISSIGYAIDVYQESINKVFREYLVNFEYLNTILEQFGFVMLSQEELNEKGLPSSTGSFRDMFKLMDDECKRNPRNNSYRSAMEMTTGEKNISFLNRYIVYRKIHDVDGKQLATVLDDGAKQPDETIPKETVKPIADETPKPVRMTIKRKPVTLKKSKGESVDVSLPERDSVEGSSQPKMPTMTKKTGDNLLSNPDMKSATVSTDAPSEKEQVKPAKKPANKTRKRLTIK